MTTKCAALAVLAALAASGPTHAGVTISTAATMNMTCAGGVCAPTEAHAVLNVNDLENLLATGNVEVTTTNSSVQAKNIQISAPLTWATANALFLDAYRAISVEKSVSITGIGGMSLMTNDGGSGGLLSFGVSGNVQFANLSSELTINGTAFTLVNSIASLASAIAANPAGDYALANDYDASQDGTYSDSPVTTTLTGTVQGLGNTIFGISLVNDASPEVVGGLFSQINLGVVENLNLSNLILTYDKLGGTVGGFVGSNNGTAFNCHVDGQVWAHKIVNGSIGGFAGYSSGMIANSGTTDSVIGGVDSSIGGLVGSNAGIINISFATGRTKGSTDSTVGGLVGRNGGTIVDSYARGSANIGKNAYAGSVGGFVGGNVGTIGTSYSTGSAKADTSAYVGGFAGVDDSGNGISESYWDTTTSGLDQGTGRGNEAGITGLTTQQLQSGLPAGFDPAIWGEKAKINNGLPYLLANPPPK